MHRIKTRANFRNLSSLSSVHSRLFRPISRSSNDQTPTSVSTPLFTPDPRVTPDRARVPGAARGRPSAEFSARISLPLSSVPSLSPPFFSFSFSHFSSFLLFLLFPSPLSFPARSALPSLSPHRARPARLSFSSTRAPLAHRTKHPTAPLASRAAVPRRSPAYTRAAPACQCARMRAHARGLDTPSRDPRARAVALGAQHR